MIDLSPFALVLPYLLRALAGGAGGGIRWWSAANSWRTGLGHVAAGAVAGIFFGPAIVPAIKPLADLSGMDALDTSLFGAHVAGVLGLNIYAVLPDLLKAWLQSQASKSREPKA